MKKQKTNKVKTVVYLIHFILIDIWARNGVLHIFWGGEHIYIYIYIKQLYKTTLRDYATNFLLLASLPAFNVAGLQVAL